MFAQQLKRCFKPQTAFCSSLFKAFIREALLSTTIMLPVRSIFFVCALFRVNRIAIVSHFFPARAGVEAWSSHGVKLAAGGSRCNINRVPFPADDRGMIQAHPPGLQ